MYIILKYNLKSIVIRLKLILKILFTITIFMLYIVGPKKNSLATCRLRIVSLGHYKSIITLTNEKYRG